MRWLWMAAVLGAGCDEATAAQRCDRDRDAAQCLTAAREKLAGAERDLALYYFNRACELGTFVACHERAAVLRSDPDPESAHYATEAFADACRRDVGASCLEWGRALRDGIGVAADAYAAREALDRACRGGEAAACSERDAIPADSPPPVADVPVAPAVSGRPWFYPEGFPILQGGTVHDRIGEQRRITFADGRPVVAERLTAAAQSAGWLPEEARSGPTGTLLRFARQGRRVFLRVADEGSGASLLVISDLVQGAGGD
jgi:hypothetical protein